MRAILTVETKGVSRAVKWVAEMAKKMAGMLVASKAERKVVQKEVEMAVESAAAMGV